MGMYSSPKAPDTKPVAEASAEAARLANQLGNAQLSFAKTQYNDLKPLFAQITASDMAVQAQTLAQGKDYYDYQQKTFRPLEEKLVAEANEFNTEAYRDREAGKAGADAGRAFGNTQAMSARAQAAMGVNPNSGKAAAMANQNNLGLAAARAGSMTGARQRAQDVGYARMMDATGLGRGLAGASQGAYGLAISSGNAAGANAMAPGSQYMAGMSAGAGTIMNGQNAQINGLSNVLNSQTSTYNTNKSAQMEMTGSVAGAGLGMMSDIRLKENIELVGTTVHDLPLYTFNYIGDERRYQGVMAQDVEKVVPEAVIVAANGYLAVNYAMLGIEMTEI